MRVLAGKNPIKNGKEYTKEEYYAESRACKDKQPSLANAYRQ